MSTTMKLYDSFKGVYEKETAEAPYSNRNLYSTIHLSENDHTQILWDIIRYRKNGKYVFFESFIEKCLQINNIKMKKENVLSEPKATQYKALSNKSKDNKKSYGFIDLLLKDDQVVIIIENKVCDASDGKNQLTRYFYTFAKYDNDLESLKAKVTIDSPNKNTYEDDNIYVVYLSKDESTVFPSEESNSLPDFLQKRLKLIKRGDNSLYDNKNYSIPDESHYIHISYTDDILPWLKDHVLPEISAYNSQEFFRSMYLYVDYLENDLLGQTQKSRDIYIAEVYNNIVVEFYKKITKWSEVWLKLHEELVNQKDKNNKLKDEDLQVRNAYIIFLRAQLNRILNGKLKDGWKAYCTPSFILLYKEEWRKLSPNTDIPVLNLYLSPSFIKNLLSDNNKKKNNNNISFNIERVKSDKPEWKSKLIGDLKDKYTCTITNREQVYRYKEAYSITKKDDSLSIICENKDIETALSNIIK